MVTYQSSFKWNFLHKWNILLGLVLLSFTGSAEARKFYFSSSQGNDSRTSTQAQNPDTPWKSIAKLNSGTFLPGDFILFKKGDLWNETLKIPSSGSVSAPIVVSAYGNGDDPVIGGLTAITGWENEGNGIFSKVIAVENNTLNVVTVNGLNMGKGRYPNTGFLTYESFQEDISITDNQLTNTPNWTGAEVVIRRTRWSLETCPVTEHLNSKLTIKVPTTLWNFNAGYGYFIQNDIKTLDTLGEWYYGNGRLYMYFGDVDPATKTVKVSKSEKCISFIGRNNITIDGISFEGANVSAIQFSGTDITIKNCTFANVQKGICLDTSNSYYTIVDNNTFTNVNDISVDIMGQTNTAWIKNNTILNNGIIKGLGSSNDRGYDAISIYGPNSIVEYNVITNVGHSGIAVRTGDKCIIRNNYIKNFGLSRYDGGGIYSWNRKGTTVTSRIISYNIIDGSNTVVEGVAGNTSIGLNGIYLDEYSQYTTIDHNTVANCYSAGINITNASLVNITGNTCYNNGYQLRFYRSNYGQDIQGMRVTGNKFIAKTSTQSAFYFKNDTSNFSSFGIADSNYYSRPIDDGQLIVTSTGGKDTPRNLSNWQSLSLRDMHSQKSPGVIKNTSDLKFEYNVSDTNKVVPLSNSYTDFAGIIYTNTITIPPFGSVVLIKR